MQIRYNTSDTLCRKSAITVLFLWYVFLFWGMLLTGCTADTPALQDIVNLQEQQPQAQSKPPIQPIEIVISHNQTPGTPEDTAAKAMQAKLQQLLGDNAQIAVYADYQLGSAREQLEAVQLGRVHITIQSVSEAAQIVEDMGVFTLPYLFSSNPDDVIALLSGPMGQEALAHMNETKINETTQPFTGLGLWFGGYKLFTFHGDNYKTITDPADFCGLTMAISGAAITTAQYHQWGADTTNVDSIALYSALEQRIADGTEATAQQIVSHRLYEVQHNIVQAYHSPEIYMVLANKEWYSTLAPDVQAAITEAEAYSKDILYQSLQEQTPIYYNTIAQTEHMHYSVLTEAQIDTFRQSVQPLYITQLAGHPWMMEYVGKVKNTAP